MRKVAEKSYVPVVFLLDLAAELSGQMYRLRWLIETFFRMFKQLLGCRHLLSTKQNGVKIRCLLWHHRLPLDPLRTEGRRSGNSGSSQNLSHGGQQLPCPTGLLPSLFFHYASA